MPEDIDLSLPEGLQRRGELRRLEILEGLPTTKLNSKQLEELAGLLDRYGSSYERRLQSACSKFRTILEGPRFLLLREFPDQGLLRQQLDDLGSYMLPERASLITPERSREIRGELANRLVTVSALRRHAVRNANQLEQAYKLAENIWKGLSPADREWRMEGEMTELLDPLQSKLNDAKILADEGERVYWDLKTMLEAIEGIMRDWDRSANKDAVSRESRKTNDDL